jgi:3-oxoacyl-[acyl-carrier-protein] synthase-3
MTPSAFVRSRIAGTGRYLPRRKVSNEELGLLVGEHPDEILRRTGIGSRRFAAADEAASDLALAAASRALQASDRQARDVDCIIFATHTPDYFFPGCGCILAAKLGLVGIPALDVRNQCSGFLYGLSVADHFIRLGTYRTVLVVGAEVMSSGLEFSPRGRLAATAFSDGAGAAILVAEQDRHRGLLGSGLHSDGRFAPSLSVALPGSRHHRPLCSTDLDAGRHLPVLGGGEVLDQAYARVREAIAEALERCNLSVADIKLFIPNQGIAQLAPLLCRRLGVPPERIHVDLREHGNATGASIPISLDTAVRQQLVVEEDVVLLIAFGSGFSWGWVVIRW